MISAESQKSSSDYARRLREVMAYRLGRAGLEYSETSFKLRAGGTSNWYFDGRRAISGHPEFFLTCKVMLTEALAIDPGLSIVAGLGVGGRALANGIGIVALDKGLNLEVVEANDDKSPGQRYGYGLHGSAVKTKRVLAVDDTASTGDSLTTLVNMVWEDGGEVVDTLVLVDRSNGMAAAAMAEIGVNFRSIYNLDETGGRLVQSLVA